MDQSVTNTPTLEAQAERIAKRIENTGYGAGYEPKILEFLKNGVKEFTLPADKVYQYGEDRMAVNFFITKSPKNPDISFLSAMEAMLDKAVQVNPIVIKDQADNLVLDIRQLDQKLANPPAENASIPEKKTYTDEISKDMKFLLDKQLVTEFNQLHVKHNPVLNFPVPAEQLQQQAQIIKDNSIHNVFSSYYNLGPNQMYNMLRHDQPVLKTLYKTRQLEPNESPSFVAWIKVNQQQRNDHNQFKIDYVQARVGETVLSALVKYNFAETFNDIKLIELEKHLKNGGIAEVTHLGDKGQKYIKIGADPGFNMNLKLFYEDGTLIRGHNVYLRNPVEKVKTETLALVDRKTPPRPEKSSKVLLLDKTGKIITDVNDKKKSKRVDSTANKKTKIKK